MTASFRLEDNPVSSEPPASSPPGLTPRAALVERIGFTAERFALNVGSGRPVIRD